MPRKSLHVESHGAVGIARHYIRDLVYGANDGIITTFAVVAGVAGGSLSSVAVLVVGAANLAADGVVLQRRRGACRDHARLLAEDWPRNAGAWGLVAAAAYEAGALVASIAR